MLSFMKPKRLRLSVSYLIASLPDPPDGWFLVEAAICFVGVFVPCTQSAQGRA